jgi:TolB protein
MKIVASILLFVVCSLTSLFLPTIFATPIITISKGAQRDLYVASFAGEGGGALRAQLKKDLRFSGEFQLLDQAPGGVGSTGIHSYYQVSGKNQGNQLEGKLLNGAGEVLLLQSYHGSLGSRAHRFCDDIVRTVTGHPGIASSKIAFVNNRTGHKELYLVDYDGANLRQITHDKGLNVSPSLSPGATLLAYTGYQTGYADIYLINLKSGARQRFLHFPGTNSGARFSPTGQEVACMMSKNGRPALYVVSLSGRIHQVTRARGAESSGTWSPDNHQLIFVSDQSGGPRLYQMNFLDATMTPVTTGLGYATEPNWSPDGKKLLFNTRSEGGFAIALLEIGRGAARVIARGQNPVWGADSRHFLFVKNHQLIMMDLANKKEETLLPHLKGEISEPTWSR